MSLSRTTTIWCSVPDCTEWAYVGEETVRPISDGHARDLAARQGWSSRREFSGWVDRCPEHTREHA